MSQFRLRNPYDPNYALPPSVMAEPPGRGTYTTEQLARRFYDEVGHVPGPWQAGYAIPEYVVAQEPGRGAAVTHQLRRRTVTSLVPNALGEDPLHRIGGVPARDPIDDYGTTAAGFILGALRGLPEDLRPTALMALLDGVKPGLASRVDAETRRLVATGLDPTEALRRALASCMSSGLRTEFIDLARGKMPQPRSLSGIMIYGGQEALDGILDVITYPARKIGEAAKTAAKAVVSVHKKIGSGIKTAAVATGSAIKTAAAAVKDFGADAIEKLQDFACNAGKQVTAVGAGDPQIGAGAAIATGFCDEIKQPAPAPLPAAVPAPLPQASSGLPGWVLPAAGIAVVGVTAAVLIARSRRE